MHAAVEHPTGSNAERRPRLFPFVMGGLALLFLAAPWSWQHKAHAALHGLCAQTPSHTLYLGDVPLPFDSRMTGIYGGFLATMIVLVARGRHRSARLPGWPVIGLLASFVLAMAVDGFNSLLLDLLRPNLYPPDNRLRLLTGTATGISLAVVVCYLFALSLWRAPDPRARVVIGRDVPLLLTAQIPFVALALSGAGWLAFPLSLLLVIAAVIVISSLALVAIVLFRRLDATFDTVRELHGVATAAVLAGVAVMASLSGARFLLEHLLNIQSLR